MLLTWLRKILGLHSEGTSLNPKREENDNLEIDSSIKNLEEKKRIAQKEKENIKLSDCTWFSLINTTKGEKIRNTELYIPRVFEKIPTLQSLKAKRLQKEKDEQIKLENSIKVLLDKLDVYLSQKKGIEAKQIIKELSKNEIVRVKDLSIKERYNNLQKAYIALQNDLERERLVKLAEERKRKEEEECKRKEKEEKEKIEIEKRITEERIRQQQEANRLAEEAMKKEQAELAEKKRLEALSTERKENWSDFKRILDNNDIRYLYHFTDRRNIQSIKLHGGLFSWHYCRKNNITIPCQGGDYNSQELDKKYGLEDYVRLSFCNDHPMAYRLQQSGSDIVILKIETDVALLKDTLFSDINAADILHTHGGELDDLKRINFNATKRNYVRKDDVDFKPHQAEVMVKTFVPKKFIRNLDNF